MLDRVTGLQVFVRVSQAGSLSGAARALGMSQTMATKHMAALEDRLGTKLVHRTTRRLTLTEAGRRYLEAAERILADLEEADARVSAEATDVRGTLRLNAPFSYGIRRIAPLLPELALRHPALAVDLGLNDRYVDLVEEGWDLAIRIGSMDSSSMIARRLAPCPMLLCAAPSYLERHGRPRIVADLAGHNCLEYTLSRSNGAGLWAFGPNGKSRVAVKGTLRANNGDALLAAARAGLGIIYHPDFIVADDIAMGRLVALELDEPAISLGGVYAVYPADRRPPAKVRSTIDFLADRLGPGHLRANAQGKV